MANDDDLDDAGTRGSFGTDGISAAATGTGLRRTLPRLLAGGAARLSGFPTPSIPAEAEK
jgi:hypothetical protein